VAGWGGGGRGPGVVGEGERGEGRGAGVPVPHSGPAGPPSAPSLRPPGSPWSCPAPRRPGTRRPPRALKHTTGRRRCRLPRSYPPPPGSACPASRHARPTRWWGRLQTARRGRASPRRNCRRGRGKRRRWARTNREGTSSGRQRRADGGRRSERRRGERRQQRERGGGEAAGASAWSCFLACLALHRAAGRRS
jgi:hypothetical protein